MPAIVDSDSDGECAVESGSATTPRENSAKMGGAEGETSAAGEPECVVPRRGSQVSFLMRPPQMASHNMRTERKPTRNRSKQAFAAKLGGVDTLPVDDIGLDSDQEEDEAKKSPSRRDRERYSKALSPDDALGADGKGALFCKRKASGLKLGPVVGTGFQAHDDQMYIPESFRQQRNNSYANMNMGSVNLSSSAVSQSLPPESADSLTQLNSTQRSNGSGMLSPAAEKEKKGLLSLFGTPRAHPEKPDKTLLAASDAAASNSTSSPFGRNFMSMFTTSDPRDVSRSPSTGLNADSNSFFGRSKSNRALQSPSGATDLSDAWTPKRRGKSNSIFAMFAGKADDSSHHASEASSPVAAGPKQTFPAGGGGGGGGGSGRRRRGLSFLSVGKPPVGPVKTDSPGTPPPYAHDAAFDGEQAKGKGKGVAGESPASNNNLGDSSFYSDGDRSHFAGLSVASSNTKGRKTSGPPFIVRAVSQLDVLRAAVTPTLSSRNSSCGNARGDKRPGEAGKAGNGTPDDKAETDAESSDSRGRDFEPAAGGLATLGDPAVRVPDTEETGRSAARDVGDAGSKCLLSPSRMPLPYGVDASEGRMSPHILSPTASQAPSLPLPISPAYLNQTMLEANHRLELLVSQRLIEIHLAATHPQEETARSNILEAEADQRSALFNQALSSLIAAEASTRSRLYVSHFTKHRSALLKIVIQSSKEVVAEQKVSGRALEELIEVKTRLALWLSQFGLDVSSTVNPDDSSS
eukprot:gene13421-20676_t